jgi:hypothetical protein
VIGGSGDLVGYAGNKVALKQRLLTLEGVPVGGGDTLHVERGSMYVSIRRSRVLLADLRRTSLDAAVRSDVVRFRERPGGWLVALLGLPARSAPNPGSGVTDFFPRTGHRPRLPLTSIPLPSFDPPRFHAPDGRCVEVNVDANGHRGTGEMDMSSMAFWCP